MIRSFCLVLSNQSLLSDNSDCFLFKHIFPNSNTAHGYSWLKIKAKYLIPLGITPCVFEDLNEEIREKSLFSFWWENYITGKEAVQWIYGYISSSPMLTKKCSRICGSLFLGHFIADDLVNCLNLWRSWN